MPGAIFVVDPKKERIAVKEARILGIPVIGIVDTNCDPDDVDYVIPANDDAIRAVKLIAGRMADAVIEANQEKALTKAPVQRMFLAKKFRKLKRQKAQRTPNNQEFREEKKMAVTAQLVKRIERENRSRHDGLQEGFSGNRRRYR